MSHAKETMRKVAESSDKLYSALPENVSGLVTTGVEDVTGSSGAAGQISNAVNFVKGTLQRRDQKQLEHYIRRPFVLGKQSGTKIRKAPPARKNGKRLTARERRDLGLNRLPRKGAASGVKFADLHDLHQVWQGYMADLINWKLYKPGDESVQTRLCRADYHGSLVKVTRSPTPSLVGVEGYVAVETRNTFQVVGRDDVLRIVPKKNASFSFLVGRKERGEEQFLVTLAGSNLCLRPADRAVKKWKNKPPMDF